MADADNADTLETTLHGEATAEGGCAVHYWILNGKGTESSADVPRVVLIEGIVTTHTGWLPTAHSLAQTRGWHVMVLDNRGVGLSVAKPSEPSASSSSYAIPSATDEYTTALVARDVACALRHCGWWPRMRVHVVGASMGGMVAQELAAMNPMGCASLSLVSTRAGGSFFTKLPSWGTVLAFARTPFAKGDKALMLTAKSVYSKQYLSENRDAIIEALRKDLEKTGEPDSAVVRQHIDAALRHDSSAKLPAIRVAGIPVQVLHGTADPMIGFELGRTLARELHCELHEAEGAGHVLPEERTEWFMQRLTSFVEASNVDIVSTSKPTEAVKDEK